MTRIKIPLLLRIIIAITLGILAGNILPLPAVRIFATFNSIFSSFLSFIIPLICFCVVAVDGHRSYVTHYILNEI